MRGLVREKAWRWALHAGLGAAVCLAALGAAAQAASADNGLQQQGASTGVRSLVGHVLGTADHRGRPWAVVDKAHARLFVLAADGRLLGATPALLGLARGDISAPGVGPKAASYIPPEERTTPAGRFMSRPAQPQGRSRLWVDYTAAVAIHRLRPAPPQQRRRSGWRR